MKRPTMQEKRERRRRRATGAAETWQQHLETIIGEGWTGPGQTNQLLKGIATYGRVFKKLQGVELYNYILEKAENAPDYHQYCNHQHEIFDRCGCWAAAVEKYYVEANHADAT